MFVAILRFKIMININVSFGQNKTIISTSDVTHLIKQVPMPEEEVEWRGVVLKLFKCIPLRESTVDLLSEFEQICFRST